MSEVLFSSKNFMNEERKEQVKRAYKCPYCDYVFLHEDIYEIHVEVHKHDRILSRDFPHYYVEIFHVLIQRTPSLIQVVNERLSLAVHAVEPHIREKYLENAKRYIQLIKEGLA